MRSRRATRLLTRNELAAILGDPATLKMRCDSAILRVSLLAALLLVACSRVEFDEPMPSDDMPRPTGVSPEVMATEPPAHASGGGTGEGPAGTLRLAWIGIPVPDPAAIRGPHSDLFLREVYTGLTQISGDDGRAEPALAESWVVDDGGRRYVFTLRNGVKFSDGTDITAADFAWSWARALSPSFAEGPAREVLGSIVGADDVLSGDASDLEGLVATDDRTLEVRLRSPLPHFPQLLAEPVATVLSRENVESWGFDWSDWQSPPATPRRLPWVFDELPVSSGPFAVSAFDAWDNRMVLRRNHYFWGEPAKIEEIEIDAQEDIAGLPFWDPVGLLMERVYDAVPAYGSQTDFGVAVDVPATEASDFLVLDPAVPALQDVDFRRAMVEAMMVHRSGTSGLSGWWEDSPTGAVEWIASDGLLPAGNGCSRYDADTGTNARDSSETSLLEDARLGEPQTLLYYSDATEISRHIAAAASVWDRELNLELEVIEVSPAQRRGFDPPRYQGSRFKDVWIDEDHPAYFPLD